MSCRAGGLQCPGLDEEFIDDLSNSLDHMLAGWNESDPSMVRSHLERAPASGVEFIDPSVETHGLDDFEANVHNVQAGLPGAE